MREPKCYLSRKIKRYQKIKDEKEYKAALVSQGKKIGFDKAGKPIIVDAKKPYRKEK